MGGAKTIMLTPTKLRALDLEAPTQPGRLLHLSAASGLVRAGKFLYVVADDEFSLGVFKTEDNAPGTLIRLLPGELPGETEARKAEKADFEALVRLPAFETYAAGALLALGSGSKKTRRRGVLLGLASDGAIAGPARAVELSAFYAPLKEMFGKPNVEGAFVAENAFFLLQRGNKGLRRNALVRYRLETVLAAIVGRPAGDLAPESVIEFELGEAGGIPLGFTDAAAVGDGRFVFSAVAENTEDAEIDGRCAGSAIGIGDTQGALLSIQLLEAAHKIEGIDCLLTGDKAQLRLVTDGDDATKPAELLAVELDLANRFRL
jgi:hypothetical protein